MSEQVSEQVSGVSTSNTSGAPSNGNNANLDSTVRRSRLIALLVVVGLIVMVAVFATRPSPQSRQQQQAQSALVGQPAPDVKGTTLGGEAFDLGNLRGRWVVVNFFATWCGPCLEEHPELVAFSNRYSNAQEKADAPQVVSIAYQDKRANVEEFFKNNGGNWPILPDDSGATAVAFGARGLPESFIVDPQGNIAGHKSGGVTVSELAKETKR